MNNIIEHRKKVYINFPQEGKNISSTDIVLFYDIGDKEYTELVAATKKFILKSLTLVHGREFTWTDDFLKTNDNLLQSLPSKTPNGVLNPKKETVSEFKEIVKAVNTILRKTKIYPHIKKLTIPNLRYKSTTEPKGAKDRPYYTGKIHSDAWVGHKGDSVFLIGILGDISNNTVEFNEPINPKEDYLHKAQSFDEGNTRYESLKYLGQLDKQILGIMDHACAHRTLIKQGGGPRVSLDLAVLIDSEFSHANDEGFDEKAYTYFDSNIMEDIGSSYDIEVQESIFNSTSTTVKIRPA